MFKNIFKNQGIDVIRWDNPSSEILVWKFDQHLDQIENKSSLIVDPGLASIFVQNGKIEAIQKDSGKWTLETDNIPFISALKNIMSGFETHNKAQVYFIKTNKLANNKWGTPNPIRYIDPVYNFPVELRAFGNFTFKVCDIENFWLNYVANISSVSIDDIRMIIVDRIVGRIGSILAKKKISYNEIHAHNYDIAQTLKNETSEEFTKLGFELTDFRIEDTNFTEKTNGFIDKITSKSADVAAINKTSGIDRGALNNYSEIEKLNIAGKAAENSGSAGDMMGAGIGMAMGMNMANDMKNKSQNISNNNNDGEESIENKLEKLKSLYDKQLITKDDYDKKRSEIISNL